MPIVLTGQTDGADPGGGKQGRRQGCRAAPPWTSATAHSVLGTWSHAGHVCMYLDAACVRKPSPACPPSRYVRLPAATWRWKWEREERSNSEAHACGRPAGGRRPANWKTEDVPATWKLAWPRTRAGGEMGRRMVPFQPVRTAQRAAPSSRPSVPIRAVRLLLLLVGDLGTSDISVCSTYATRPVGLPEQVANLLGRVLRTRTTSRAPGTRP